LDNVVFRAGKAVALIDFDLASPGCSLWDIACAARLWAPLRPDSYINDVRRDRVLDRFRLFVDSYGLVDADRLRVVDAVAQNHNWCYDNVRNSAAQGHLAFSEYWNAAATERAQRIYQWCLENLQALRAALV
jgi:thiamine kinase-like enzyme